MLFNEYVFLLLHNCQKQWHGRSNQRALSDQWGFMQRVQLGAGKASMWRERAWSKYQDRRLWGLDGQWGDERSSCATGSSGLGWVIGTVYRQQGVAEWETDVRQDDAVSICIALYVCKGMRNWTKAEIIAFLKWAISFFLKQCLPFPLPQRQCLSTALADSFHIFLCISTCNILALLLFDLI